MSGLLQKKIIGVVIIGMSFFYISELANAASYNDMKGAVTDGTGNLVHPNLYRELTDEEKESVKDWPEPPTQTNRLMTAEEATEYIRFVEEYQVKNQTSEVPYEAYDYIQYISEKLVDSSSSKITDELRIEAQKYIKEMKSKSKNAEEKVVGKSDEEKKETKKVKAKTEKLSLWKKFISLKWFD